MSLYVPLFAVVDDGLHSVPSNILEIILYYSADMRSRSNHFLDDRGIIFTFENEIEYDLLSSGFSHMYYYYKGVHA